MKKVKMILSEAGISVKEGEKNENIPASGEKPDFGVSFFRNSIVHWMFIATIFLNAVNWAMSRYYIRPVDYPIILHYNVYFGVDMLGDWWQMHFLPLMGAIFFLINGTLAYFFYGRRERIAAYIFLLASFLVQAGMIIASASIIVINY